MDSYTGANGNPARLSLAEQENAILNLRNAYSQYKFDNKMTGNLPMEIANLSKLEELSVANNSFEGLIPVGISKMENLTTLMLNNNQFETKIDVRIINMPSLIDFKFNPTPNAAKENAIVFD